MPSELQGVEDNSRRGLKLIAWATHPSSEQESLYTVLIGKITVDSSSLRLFGGKLA